MGAQDQTRRPTAARAPTMVQMHIVAIRATIGRGAAIPKRATIARGVIMPPSMVTCAATRLGGTLVDVVNSAVEAAAVAVTVGSICALVATICRRLDAMAQNT